MHCTSNGSLALYSRAGIAALCNCLGLFLFLFSCLRLLTLASLLQSRSGLIMPHRCSRAWHQKSSKATSLKHIEALYSDYSEQSLPRTCRARGASCQWSASCVHGPPPGCCSRRSVHLCQTCDIWTLDTGNHVTSGYKWDSTISTTLNDKNCWSRLHVSPHVPPWLFFSPVCFAVC